MTLLLLIFGGMLLFASAFALAIWSVVRGEARATQMLEDWLRDNDFQLLQKSAPWIKDNPFFLGSNRSQKVFKITIRDKTGQIRQGWLRCGHALAGVAITQTEVKWDVTANNQTEPRNHFLPAP